MKLKGFNYYRPKSKEEALDLLDKLTPEAKLMAGGTDVLVEFRSKGKSSANVISLKGLSEELSYIKEDESGNLRIGSLTTHRELEKNILIKNKYTVLHDAVSQVGSVQIRNVATIGGNICSSLPSADSAAPLLALKAKVNVVSKGGTRTIELEEFFIGPGKNMLNADEIVLEIVIPAIPSYSCGAYIKHTRREAMELPLAGVAVVIMINKDTNTCLDARIALTSSAPVPFRSKNAEKLMIGNIISEELMGRIGEAALLDASPRTSFRCTEEYRCSIIPVIVERAIMKSLSRLEI